MVVDELDEDEEAPGADLHTAEGANNPQGEGGDVEDTVVEEENKGNPITTPDDDEGFEGREADAGEERAQTQTLITPIMEDVPTTEVSTSSTGGLSAEKLAIMKRSKPLEYLKAMLSFRESSSDKILSTSVSEDQPSRTPAYEVLSKIKDKVFKGDLFLLLLADPSAPLTLKALPSQVNMLEASLEVANVILEIGTMIDQVVADHKLLPQLTGEIEKKYGFEDAATESTNKAMELEQTKQKNKEKVEGHNCNIASWGKQIEELQAKIFDVERRRDQLLEFDEALMAQEISFGMEFVQKARQLESDVKLLRSNRFLCEKRLELLKAKYLQIKANLPF